MDPGVERPNALSCKNGSAEKSKSGYQIEKPAKLAHRNKDKKRATANMSGK